MTVLQEIEKDVMDKRSHWFMIDYVRERFRVEILSLPHSEKGKVIIGIVPMVGEGNRLFKEGGIFEEPFYPIPEEQ